MKHAVFTDVCEQHILFLPSHSHSVRCSRWSVIIISEVGMIRLEEDAFDHWGAHKLKLKTQSLLITVQHSYYFLVFQSFQPTTKCCPSPSTCFRSCVQKQSEGSTYLWAIVRFWRSLYAWAPYEVWQTEHPGRRHLQQESVSDSPLHSSRLFHPPWVSGLLNTNPFAPWFKTYRTSKFLLY